MRACSLDMESLRVTAGPTPAESVSPASRRAGVSQPDNCRWPAVLEAVAHGTICWRCSPSGSVRCSRTMYIGWRIATDLPGPLWAGLFIVLLVASAILIPLAFFGRRSRNRATADRASWAGMLGARIVLHAAGADAVARRRAAAGMAVFGIDGFAAWSAIAVPLLALAIVANRFRQRTRAARAVREVEVPVDGLPAALHGFTIAQISDIRLSGRRSAARMMRRHRRCGERIERRC